MINLSKKKNGCHLSMLLLILSVAISIQSSSSFGLVSPSPLRTRSLERMHASTSNTDRTTVVYNENGKGGDNNDKSSFMDKVDSFLDTQFFDPDQVIESSSSSSSPSNKQQEEESNNPMVWFANLVKNDYESAEALYAAGFISILVILTQEALRMVKYGDAYIPFTKIGNGSLF
jgi:hypothetical protein